MIPDDWIDKLFNCMQEFYGERWTRYFSKVHPESLYKTIWKNGLVGLTYKQIKSALIKCKYHARDTNDSPPHVMEFFRYAIGGEQPFIDYSPAKQAHGSPEVARKYLDDIRRKTRGYVNNVIL